MFKANLLHILTHFSSVKLTGLFVIFLPLLAKELQIPQKVKKKKKRKKEKEKSTDIKMRVKIPLFSDGGFRSSIMCFHVKTTKLTTI